MAQQPAIDPMHQFLVQKIWQGPVFEIGGITFDMSITNSVASMIGGAVILMAFFALTARGQIVPNRGQAFAEAIYGIVDKLLVQTIIGPAGVLGGIAMVLIEMISYFVRPMTLAMRLFGNMLGGHVVLSLFGSFVVALGILGLSGGLSSLAFLPAALSFVMIVGLTGLELVVAILQAFVFVALATVYLNEVVNFGHGH